MNRIRDPIFALIIFMIGFLIISILFFTLLPNDSKKIINYISIMGTYSSVYGIFVAYIQILSVKESANVTKQEVEKANKKVIKILSISDLSKAIKIVQEVQTNLVSGREELSIIRLKDLKSILIQLKYNKELKTLTTEETYTDLLSKISIHMTNINNDLIGSKEGYNKGTVISDLEEIENQLNEFEGKLKFENHD